MLQFINVSKSYGERVLLSNITFSMIRGERLGLVGRNGCGKSTLFKLIVGEEDPDSGTISTPRDYRRGHLPQHLHFNEETIVDEVCLGLPARDRDQRYRAEILLSGLGFSLDDMQLPATHFSGGFQIRVNLARVLISEPNLLLLDEPTNYLDILSARWLTNFLRQWKNELIIISHDRDFLDKVTTHTMLIHRQGIRKIPGGTQKIYDDIALQEELYERTRVNEDKKRREVEVFINRFRAKATKAAAVQSRIKALEKMGTKEALQDEEVLDFKFTETSPFHGRFLLEAKNISFGYNPADPLIKNLSFNIAEHDRIGVIGKNGKGKSTLLRILAKELSPNSGQVDLNLNTKPGYFGQTNIARLNPTKTIEEEITDTNPNLSRTRVRTICGTMMFSGDDGLKKISVLSGGEKSRVLLGKLLALPTNLLFLDEPTNHLDMESIEALVESVKEYQGGLVIVTHSESILRSLATRLIVFQGEQPTLFEGTYDDFLNQVGWEDENIALPSAASTSSSNIKTTKRNAKQEVTRIENQITRLEAEIKEMQEEMDRLYAANELDKMTDLGTALAAASQEIEERFEELELVSKELE